MERFGICWGTLISWRPGIAAAVLAPAAVTLLGIPRDHLPAAIVALLYVLAVVVAARLGGAIPGAAASVLSFLSLNFFFTSPPHTFAVGAPRLLVALFVCLIVAGVVGLLLSSAMLSPRRSAANQKRDSSIVSRRGCCRVN
jgi:two-component system sensor histidine kinase KdpD